MIALSEEVFYEKIGERIRNYRLTAGINQEVFSELLNMTRSSVVNIEKGRQRPSLYLLITIANILKVDYIDLVPVELNIERVEQHEQTLREVDFSSVIASSNVDLNERVKNSINQFMNQITK
ncbi:XRE family transcriptional regulator [Mucilaginibacter conchicola]|uniref:XRE family transcriptional regulator n=1 Tax=Mucilaginibacter conchicola TaxID=2303333 RepID=A0A372NV95_9SPHI|nr:helix-turn-helix transcriptional regulator [Mucilaginibacter conchicola]RFZ92944.1 XRE family transcriptional regulator [Mucilaginibacter conchicola]